MNLGFGRHVLGIGLAAALLPACGGPQTAAPQSAMPGLNATQKAAGSAGDLLYVADINESTNVSIFTYPAGRPYATISNIGPTSGICSDAMGDVWVDSLGFGASYEYAHGGTTPITVLSFSTGAVPTGCSVDPSTGNLATINMFGPGSGPTMIVWPHALGPATSYSTPFAATGCTYDDRGNLFIDGPASVSGAILLAELPRGGSAFETITLDAKNATWAGGIEWDGKYVAVTAQSSAGPREKRHVIYRIKVSGSEGRIVGTTYLRHEQSPAWIWFEGKTLVAATNSEVGLWKYPQGGRPFKKITGPQAASGVTVSVAPTR